MGQLLLVQGGGAEEVRSVFDRAVAIFRAASGVEPHDRLVERQVAIAKFPRLTGPGSKIERPAPGRFLAASGTFVRKSAKDDFSGDLNTWDGLFFVAAGSPDAVSCATDRSGRLHAYWVETDGAVVVCTSALVLAMLTGVTLDPLACQEMLGSGSVFEDRSLFRDVRKLEPGCVYELHAGRIASKRRYWDVASLFAGGPSSGASTVPALGSALVDAVAATLQPFARPVVDLTGGFDSRAIVAAAIASGRPFECVVNGADTDEDVVSAQKIAKTFGLRLVRLRPGLDFGMRSLPSIERALLLTDGEFDAVEYADIFEIHERLASQGDATVNGSAGELCRGYWWDLLSPHVGSATFFDHAKAARRFAPDGWADGLLASPAAPSLAAHFEDVIRRANGGLDGLPNTVRADNIYLVMRMQRWAGRLASATDRIWPCATPFMFRRPVEIAMTAPIPARAHNRMARRLIEHLNPKLAALPMAGGYPAGPIRISNALRFLPLAGEIAAKAARRLSGRRSRPPPGPSSSTVAGLWAQEDVRELLEPSRMKTRELYRPEALAGFLRSSEAPGFGATRQFGRLLTLELVAQALARARA